MCTTKRKVVRNRARRSPCELPLARPPVPGAVGQLGPWRHWSACVAAWVARASHASAAVRFAVAASVATATTWAARALCAASVRRLVGFDDPGAHGHCQTK